jgi:hypothetical protein
VIVLVVQREDELGFMPGHCVRTSDQEGERRDDEIHDTVLPDIGSFFAAT